ncbi:MAG: sialic acid synthase, partial [Vicinamibacterales bacterium]
MTELLSDLFIFELANNHQGRMEHAVRIIRAMGDIARRHRIHAGVKFQYRHLDTFIHPAYRERTDVPHIPRFMGTRLEADTFRALVAEVHRQGLVSICTP